MKKTLTVTLAWMGMLLPAAASVTPDSTRLHYWNNITSQYDTIAMVIRTYDPANGNILTEFGKDYVKSAGTYENSFRNTYFYNSSGNRTSMRGENFIGGTWEWTSSEIQTYNAQGMKISSKYELNYNGSLQVMSWDSTDIVLDGSNRGIDYTLYTWDDATDALVPYQRLKALSFGSTGNMNLPNSFLYMEWDGSNWDTLFRYNNVDYKSHTGNDLMNVPALTDYQLEQYNPVTGAWTQKQEASSTQTGGKTTGIFIKEWDGSSWDTTLIDELIYDAKGNLTESNRYSWGGPGNYQLISGTRDSFVYAAPGDLIVEKKHFVYSSVTGMWNRQYFEYNYYAVLAGIQQKQNWHPGIFPNPTAGPLYIENMEGRHLQVLDLNGRILLDTPVSEKIMSLDMSAFSKGILLLKFTGPDGQTQTEKVLNR